MAVMDKKSVAPEKEAAIEILRLASGTSTSAGGMHEERAIGPAVRREYGGRSTDSTSKRCLDTEIAG